MTEGTPSAAVAEALRLLARRPLTEARLRQRLEQTFSPAAVEEAVERLKALGYLDDRRFAQVWAAQRERHRPKARWLIARELVEQGIHPRIAQEAVQGGDDAVLARRCAQQWAPRLQGLPRTTFLRRLYAYLRRRGFAPSLARQVALEVWQQTSLEAPRA
ncbi:MAG: recombination regulator RecX [Dehalococcoidia bacterium]|nr:recombination regulator RecX [Dehalococcoidia bacterium]MDW8120052.1 regulatory protein RecX [Chloroflexota bacterium]